MTISDTPSVDSISTDLIKVETLLPVTLVMSGIGQLMGCRAETVPLCYLALVPWLGPFFLTPGVATELALQALRY